MCCLCCVCQMQTENQFPNPKVPVFIRHAFHYTGCVTHSVNNFSSSSPYCSAEKWFLALQFGLHSNYFLELLFFVVLSLLLLLLLRSFCVCYGYISEKTEKEREKKKKKKWERRATPYNRVVCSYVIR